MIFEVRIRFGRERPEPDRAEAPEVYDAGVAASERAEPHPLGFTREPQWGDE